MIVMRRCVRSRSRSATGGGDGLSSARTLSYGGSVRFFKEISPEFDLMLLPSTCSTFSFPQGYPLAAYVLVLVFPFLYLSINNEFSTAVPTHDVTR